MAAHCIRPAVIVPTYNAAHLLTALLVSLQRQTVEPEVVVVDNGSTDETVTLLAEKFPEASVVSLPRNLGFARAINRGVAASSADTLVFLNNDVVCEPTFVERLTLALEPRNGIVMAAGVLLQAAAPDRIDSAGIMFDRTLLAYDYLHGEHSSVLRGVPDPLGPCGGASAFERQAFEAVGGFDENFFAYLEDVDLAVRLVSSGGRCRLAPEARAVHYHSATLGSGSARKNELMGWSRGYTIGKYRLHRQPRLFVRAAFAEFVVASGQLLVDRTAVGFKARLRGFRAGLAAPKHVFPPLPEAAERISLPSALRQRLARRRPPRRKSARSDEDPAAERASHEG